VKTHATFVFRWGGPFVVAVIMFCAPVTLLAQKTAKPDSSLAESEKRLAEQRRYLQEIKDATVAIDHRLALYGYLVSVRHQVRGSKQHDEPPSSSNNYSDDRISCLWVFDANRARFFLTNKTEETMAIKWGGVSWIDTANTSHRVMHEGVRFVDRGTDAPDTVLAPGAGIPDFLVPSDAVSVAEGKLSVEKVISFSDAGMGGRLRLMLPVLIGAEIHDYIFSFSIHADEKDLAKARAEDEAKAAAANPPPG
jgi:hypothetical protein